MKKLLALFLFISIVSTACAAETPFHIFEFNAAAGYIDRDDDTIERKLFAGEKVRGDVHIDDCRKDAKWASGFRMEIINIDESRSMAIGIVCVPQTGVFKANWVKIEDLENVVADSGAEIEVTGTNGVIPFEVSITKQALNFDIGDVSYEVDIGFKPHSMWFFGFGTQGVAKFYNTK